MKKFMLPIIVLLLIAGGAGFYLLNNKSDSPQDNQKQPQASAPEVVTLTDPKTKKQIELKADARYVVTANETPYFGKLQKINQDYFKLYEITYLAKDKIVALGNELHGPESAMYINAANVASVSELTASDSNYTVVEQFYKDNSVSAPTDAFPSSNIDDYIKKEQYQAVFAKDGKIYFTKLSTINGSLLTQSDVFVLSSENGNMQLRKVENTQLGAFKQDSMLFWENLKNDGKVSSALASYAEQN